MLIGLSQALKEGEHFPLILHLKEAGHVMVKVIIEATGATSAAKSEHNYGSPAIQVHVVIEDGKVADDQGVIKMVQGDNVTLHFSSDETHHLHIHGYDIEVEVGPGSHAMVDFKCNSHWTLPSGDTRFLATITHCFILRCTPNSTPLFMNRTAQWSKTRPHKSPKQVFLARACHIPTTLSPQ